MIFPNNQEARGRTTMFEADTDDDDEDGGVGYVGFKENYSTIQGLLFRYLNLTDDQILELIKKFGQKVHDHLEIENTRRSDWFKKKVWEEAEKIQKASLETLSQGGKTFNMNLDDSSILKMLLDATMTETGIGVWLLEEEVRSNLKKAS